MKCQWCQCLLHFSKLWNKIKDPWNYSTQWYYSTQRTVVICLVRGDGKEASGGGGTHFRQKIKGCRWHLGALIEWAEVYLAQQAWLGYSNNPVRYPCRSSTHGNQTSRPQGLEGWRCAGDCNYSNCSVVHLYIPAYEPSQCRVHLNHYFYTITQLPRSD
jgi:hypothetical protein